MCPLAQLSDALFIGYQMCHLSHSTRPLLFITHFSPSKITLPALPTSTGEKWKGDTKANSQLQPLLKSCWFWSTRGCSHILVFYQEMNLILDERESTRVKKHLTEVTGCIWKEQFTNMLKDNQDITWLPNQIKTMVHLTRPPLGPWAADIRFTEHTEVEERDNLPIVPSTTHLKTRQNQVGKSVLLLI